MSRTYSLGLGGLAVIVALAVASCGRPTEIARRRAAPVWARVAAEQIEEARKYGVPVAFENEFGMRFVLIPAGAFLMGSPEDEQLREGNETQHKVRISKPFYIQTTEVTNAQYERFRPGHDSGSALVPTTGETLICSLGGDAQPAVRVSWNDAEAFVSWLTSRDVLRTYRLPTEAEWEYACRAGTRTPFWWGQGITTAQANYDGDFAYAGGSPGEDRECTTRVGTFGANPWGLSDLHGSASEWCGDWYAPYASGISEDPRGPSEQSALLASISTPGGPLTESRLGRAGGSRVSGDSAS